MYSSTNITVSLTCPMETTIPLPTLSHSRVMFAESLSLRLSLTLSLSEENTRGWRLRKTHTAIRLNGRAM